MILPRGIQLPRAEDALNLIARQYNYGRRCNPRYQNCRSNFSRWGRWVLAGILIFFGIFLFFMFLCISKRRKRRAALHSTPMTAPAGNAGYNSGYNNGGYNNNAPTQQYAPPPGAPPPTYAGNGGYNNDYYGQQNGVAQQTYK
ncbi:hypothetical protein WAI453_000035 [Rhynchosporium graminicola]|uniref:Chitin synthesis regulation, Congo red resistance, RCR protein n=2 Tax=Rhynchosporium TaxID=38037 RepID=A0A1E1MUI3_RHYSE|nr:uncharacterized protein RCO7_10770 [Rhynchosporium commune]CZT52766.1 uncharacterized protein RSE6_14133 [Rhynchosporium secalis]